MPKHDERRVLAYSPRQLYELVADVERYPEFLPWCVAARVRQRTPDAIVADLAIGFSMLRERFTSKATLQPDGPEGPRIDMEFVNGPFRHLHGFWIFRPHVQGCEVEFCVDFEFHSPLLQKTIEMLFHEAVRRMVTAFETRARKLYGSAAVPPAS